MSELFSKPIDPKAELDLIDYMDELNLVVKPNLKILYELEEDSFQMDNQDLKCLLFTTLEQWNRIDEIFLRHNRRLNGHPESLGSDKYNPDVFFKPPQAENQTIGAGVV